MAGEHILIVDDERAIQTTLRGVLEDEGYHVSAVGSGHDAIARLAEESPDLIFLDIWMPGMDGLDALAEIMRLRPEVAVVMISGHATIETAVKATKLGAYDFIEKPLSLEKTLLAAARALEHSRLERENRALREQIQRGQEIVGRSPLIEELRQQIATAAPTNGRVLVHGENGSGKELVARAIHALSTRRELPFVEVNCAAIPEELIESELFGHERGAFTGAVARHRGKFEVADGGTLFLDEIGDMSLKTQAKVLRVLEEQAFERVGGKDTIRVDVRVLAASNQDLKEQIAQGRFREDLYYRLNVIPIEVPPLRRRKEDIPALVEHFVGLFSAENGKRPKTVFSCPLTRRCRGLRLSVYRGEGPLPRRRPRAGYLTGESWKRAPPPPSRDWLRSRPPPRRAPIRRRPPGAASRTGPAREPPCPRFPPGSGPSAFSPRP